MSVFDEPKIDCHTHIFDPLRFPYRSDTFYRPAGQEITTASQLLHLMDAYGVGGALVVGPNSGYASDNRCLLDALARGGGRLKGIAVVEPDAPAAELKRLKRSGVIGVAFNPTILGLDYYRRSRDLLTRLADLELLLQIQVEKDQLLGLLDLIADSRVAVVVDHCGRPDPDAGLDQPGFKALLELGRSGRAGIKLSGYAKFSREPYPHRDAWPYVRALMEAFTPDRCVWASDWPFLRSTQRIDYGPLLTLMEALVPDAEARRKIFWDTPRRLFGFEM
jgi:predicted TIM-barrel fold metal-dependent hydrolase